MNISLEDSSSILFYFQFLLKNGPNFIYGWMLSVCFIQLYEETFYLVHPHPY